MIPLLAGNSTSSKKKKSSDMERDTQYTLLWMVSLALIMIDQREKVLHHKSTQSLNSKL